MFVYQNQQTRIAINFPLPMCCLGSLIEGYLRGLGMQHWRCRPHGLFILRAWHTENGEIADESWVTNEQL